MISKTLYSCLVGATLALTMAQTSFGIVSGYWRWYGTFEKLAEALSAVKREGETYQVREIQWNDDLKGATIRCHVPDNSAEEFATCFDFYDIEITPGADDRPGAKETYSVSYPENDPTCYLDPAMWQAIEKVVNTTAASNVFRQLPIKTLEIAKDGREITMTNTNNLTKAKGLSAVSPMALAK